jgi:hypothetical protein
MSSRGITTKHHKLRCPLAPALRESSQTYHRLTREKLQAFHLASVEMRNLGG